MAILMYSINVPIDRMIPKGINFSLSSDTRAGAVAGLDTLIS